MEGGDLIFGIHSVREALASGKNFEKIFIQDRLKNEGIREIKVLLKERGLTCQFVPQEKLNRLTKNRNNQGAAAFLSVIEYPEIENIVSDVQESGEFPLVLILDRITDVRNFGAICRSAECMGVHAVVVPARGAALIGPDAMKTSAGALNRIPVCKSDNLKETLEFLKDSGLKIASCTEYGEKTCQHADLHGPLALILGSEEDGISGEYLKLSEEKIKIPMMGQTGSLNVSVAAGILLYEVLRQRSQS
jgi:23S rRNA (guanosine2251-2'-O)-methyltransferase